MNIAEYIMTVWKNYPTKDTAINATRLNHLEQGVKNVTDFVNTLIKSDQNFTTALKNKLDGIEDGANKYVLPKASATDLGGVKVDGVTTTIDANGVIHSPTTGVSYLKDLLDVDSTELQNKSMLRYDSAKKKWVCITEVESRSKMSELDDVLLQALDDGQILIYDYENRKWVNVDLTLEQLSNIDVSSATNGQVLKYNAAESKWEGNTLAAVANSGSYLDLKDLPEYPGALTYQETMDILNGSDVPPEVDLNKSFVALEFRADEGFDEATVEKMEPPEEG